MVQVRGDGNSPTEVLQEAHEAAALGWIQLFLSNCFNDLCVHQGFSLTELHLFLVMVVFCLLLLLCLFYILIKTCRLT